MTIETTVVNAINMAKIAGKTNVAIKFPNCNCIVYTSIAIAEFKIENSVSDLANKPCVVYMASKPDYVIVSQVCGNSDSYKAVKCLASVVELGEKFAYENGFDTHPKNVERYNG